MPTLKEILDRFRTYIYLRNVYPIEWFQEFDKLNLGKITLDQFRRSFSFIRYPFREGEFDVIANEYMVPDGRIDYRKFCDAITNIYTNKSLEKDPQGKIKNPQKIINRTLNRMENNEDPQWDRLFTKLSHQVLTRGVHLREAFMDFDRHNNGNITQSQFLRSNPFRDLSAYDIQMLLKRYSDPVLRDFNYRKLNTELNKYIDTIKQNDNRYRNATNEKPGPIRTRDLDLSNPDNHYDKTLLPHQRNSFKIRNYNTKTTDILKNFAQYVYEHRIRIREFFQQHDPLNGGLIPVNKFEGILTLFGYLFTQDDLDFLNKEYMQVSNYTNMIRWRDFCNDVETIVNSDHSETAQLQTREVTNKDLELGKIIDRIRNQIVRYRINALPTIQDFDRLGRGYISEHQFHRALTTLRIYVSDPEIKILAKEYKNDKGIDFYKFIEDVDPTHTQQRRAFRPLGTTRANIEEVWGHTPAGDRFVTTEEADRLIYQSHKGLIHKIDESKDMPSLLLALQKWAYLNSVDFHDFLQDFDVHRINEIPIDQFVTGIGLSGYKLTEDELQLIIHNYSSHKRQNYIRYSDLANDVIQFIAPLDLEKEPLVTPPSPEDKLQNGNIQSRSIQIQNMPEDVNYILDIVARFVKTRRVSLPEQFKDKDPLNHQRVTQTGFAQVLQLIGVHITKGDIGRLGIYYNDPKTNFVDYPRFIEDVVKKSGDLFTDRAASHIIAKPIPKYGNQRSEYLVESRVLDKGDYEWSEIREMLRSYVYKRRIRLVEFFEGFDPLRHGTVSIQKFRTVVGQCNFPLTPGQIESIIQKFTSPFELDMFNYREFCNEINEVFGPTELEKTPLNNGTPTARALPDPSGTIQGLTSDDVRQLDRILQRMQYIVSTRRMNIKDQFTDYDRTPRKNYITKQQFKQSIARLGLSTNPAELDLICKKYRCTDLNDMNYHAFLRDIDVTLR